MKLNIVKRSQAATFNAQVGISPQRAKHLSEMLDAMAARHLGKLVLTCDIFQEIAGFCDNVEELVYCTVTHCDYLAKRWGIYLNPPTPRSHGENEN